MHTFGCNRLLFSSMCVLSHFRRTRFVPVSSCMTTWSLPIVRGVSDGPCIYMFTTTRMMSANALFDALPMMNRVFTVRPCFVFFVVLGVSPLSIQCLDCLYLMMLMVSNIYMLYLLLSRWTSLVSMVLHAFNSAVFGVFHCFSTVSRVFLMFLWFFLDELIVWRVNIHDHTLSHLFLRISKWISRSRIGVHDQIK